MRQNIFSYKLAFWLLLAVLVGIPTGFAYAAGFPEIITGSTKAIIAGQTVYGGLGGNYAVLNHDSAASYGFNRRTTANALLQPGCLDQSFANVSGLCFVLGTGLMGDVSPGNTRLLTSRTYINGTRVAYEIPALIFAGININGDVSGSGFGYLLQFYSPNNLYQGTDSSSGNAWNLPNYSFNSAAQVSWGSDQFSQYHAKMLTLAGSGDSTIISSGIFANGGRAYLQSSSILSTPSSGDLAKSPEGKVWVVNGDIVINKSFDFSGIGTIIVRGNLTVAGGVKISPADASSRLGIIVVDDGSGTKGNCTFGAGDAIQTMLYCEKTMTVNNNSIFSGSFVANKFTVNGQSIMFSYDPAFDTSQPPGFRELSMPGLSEIGNGN